MVLPTETTRRTICCGTRSSPWWRWQSLAWLHRPRHSLAVEAAGTEVADSTGAEAVFTPVAAAFTVADLAFAEADFAGAGSAFSIHMPTVTIPTIMVMATRAAAIWSLGGS